MASNSPYVKTRGEKREGKQKAIGNVAVGPIAGKRRGPAELRKYWRQHGGYGGEARCYHGASGEARSTRPAGSAGDQPVHLAGVLSRQHRRAEGGA